MPVSALHVIAGHCLAAAATTGDSTVWRLQYEVLVNGRISGPQDRMWA